MFYLLTTLRQVKCHQNKKNFSKAVFCAFTHSPSMILSQDMSHKPGIKIPRRTGHINPCAGGTASITFSQSAGRQRPAFPHPAWTSFPGAFAGWMSATPTRSHSQKAGIWLFQRQCRFSPAKESWASSPCGTRRKLSIAGGRISRQADTLSSPLLPDTLLFLQERQPQHSPPPIDFSFIILAFIVAI